MGDCMGTADARRCHGAMAAEAAEQQTGEDIPESVCVRPSRA